MLSCSHRAEWDGPQGEEYCGAAAKRKKRCILGKTQQMVILPRKNSPVSQPWGCSTLQLSAALPTSGTFLWQQTKITAEYQLQVSWELQGELLQHDGIAEATKARHFQLPLHSGRYRAEEHRQIRYFSLTVTDYVSNLSLSLTLLRFLWADKQTFL